MSVYGTVTALRMTASISIRVDGSLSDLFAFAIEKGVIDNVAWVPDASYTVTFS